MAHLLNRPKRCRAVYARSGPAQLELVLGIWPTASTGYALRAFFHDLTTQDPLIRELFVGASSGNNTVNLPAASWALPSAILVHTAQEPSLLPPPTFGPLVNATSIVQSACSHH